MSLFFCCCLQTKKLEAAQETLELDRAEFDRKLLAETECLNLKLQSHSDSIQILVAEKSALESSVDKLRAEHLSSEGRWKNGKRQQPVQRFIQGIFFFQNQSKPWRPRTRTWPR